MQDYSNTPWRSLIETCERSRVVNAFCDHLHIKQIAHDHHQMWHETESETERFKIAREYRMQVALALLRPLGYTTGTTLVFSAFTQSSLLTLFVITIAGIYYLTR